MKTLIGFTILISSLTASAGTVQFDPNYREIVVPGSKPETLTIDAETARLILNAESITLKDGTVLNIKRDATQFIKKDNVQDIGNISGQSGTFIILGEGSGTGGGG